MRRATDELLPLSPSTFLVLLCLRTAPLHGYGIKKDVKERSQGQIDLDPAALYRLIARLESLGAVRVAATPAHAPDDDRRRVFYRLTPVGERLLTAEARRLGALLASPDVVRLLDPRTT
jgi:DNA-binding PadR family transcriptional regulator